MQNENNKDGKVSGLRVCLLPVAMIVMKAQGSGWGILGKKLCKG